MITPQALALCIFTAAQTYVVPPSVILGILSVEGGRIGQAVKNTNDTYDLGPMQINTLWIPELAKFWNVDKKEATRLVRDDPCINIGVGAWILRKNMDRTGSLNKGIAHYHSGTPKLGSKYRKKVISAMKRYKLIKTPDDIIASSKALKKSG